MGHGVPQVYRQASEFSKLLETVEQCAVDHVGLLVGSTNTMNKGGCLWAVDTGGIQNSSMAKSSATEGGRVASQIGRLDLRPRRSVLSEGC